MTSTLFYLFLSLWTSIYECKQFAFISSEEISHLAPLLSIAEAALKAGHQVTVYSALTTKKHFLKVIPEESFVSIGAGLTKEEKRKQDEQQFNSTIYEQLMRENPHLLQSQAHFDVLEKDASFQNADLCFVDWLVYRGVDACDKYNIPVVVSASGMHAVNQYADYWTSHNFLLGFSVSSSLSRTANFLLIQLFPIIYDFVMKGWHKKREEHGLKPLRYLDFFDKYVWLTYSYPPFGTTDPTSANYLRVGPMLPAYRESETLPSELDTWLTDGKPVLYVSMGTLVELEEDDILKFLKAFESLSDIRVLWSSRKEAHVISRQKPANVKVLSWVPQLAVIRHSNVFAMIGHGGIMGIIECLSSNLPMLLYPTTAEQNYNTKMIAQGGVGWIVDLDSLAVQIEHMVQNREQLQAAIVQFWSTSTKPGGASFAVKMFEHFGDFGTDHTLPRSGASIITRMNWDILFFLSLFLTVKLFVGYLCLTRCISRSRKEKIKSD